MKILYDISVIGLGHFMPRARTGIFRVAEEVGKRLAHSCSDEVFFCATHSSLCYQQSLAYWEEHYTDFADKPFINGSSLCGVQAWFERHRFAMKNNLKAMPNSRTLTARAYKRFYRGFKQFNQLLNGLPSAQNFITSESLEDADIFHSPFYDFPEHVKQAAHLKKFLTVYDLIPLHSPQFFTFKEKHFLQNLLTEIDDNTWMLCISHSTKNELCEYLPTLDPARVSVTHLAASDRFYACKDVERIAAVKAKYGIPNSPYFLSVATLEPRKNIDHVIRCFARLVEEREVTDTALVLVGTKGWNYERIFHEISQSDALAKRCFLTGYVDDDDLAPLYSGALGFVYPSLYEGFGLPPLEAMQCGVPVITSNTSSLPEVVGDAGMMLDPTDADGLSQAMLELYRKPSLRAEMAQKSLARAARFSWDKCVQETINAYHKAMEH